MGASTRLKHGRPGVHWCSRSSPSLPTISRRPLVYHHVEHRADGKRRRTEAPRQLRSDNTAWGVSWGTILGPHVMRAGERPARLCTPRTATTPPHAAHDLRKRVTATYWGSSGRRFKSCQPDNCQPDNENCLLRGQFSQLTSAGRAISMQSATALPALTSTPVPVGVAL